MAARRSLALAAFAGLGAGAVLAGTPWASAGHTNDVLEASLDGRQEVGGGDRNGRGEAYVFGVDGDPTTLCYVLLVDRIAELDLAPAAGTRMAHIHAGVAGMNGPVVANLAWPQGGQAADCITEGEAGKFPTNEDADPANDITVAEILAEPEGFYVNVHNAAHPTGAVRGQLAEQG
jgi:hypothetical protein